MTHPIRIAGEELVLHPLGGLYWPARSALLLSDLHLGKVSHFRKYGAAVPRGAILENFARLDRLVSEFRPESVYFLGDLFHSHLNAEWELLRRWTGRSRAVLHLIVGNHDILSPGRFEALGFRLAERLEIGPFVLTHHPENAPDRFNIAGHIHPAVRLAGAGQQRLRLPCFHLRANQLILPAFGTFTGTHALAPESGDRFFVLADREVIPLEPVPENSETRYHG